MKLRADRVIKDLGILFSSNLTFNEHIDSICAKAYRNLGFVKRYRDEFKNVHCLKPLYNALVRSGLEFGSTVRNLRQIGLIDKIEKIQRRCLRTAAHRFSVAGHFIPEVENQFNTTSLKSRRNFIDAYFVHELLNGFKVSPELLQPIPFNVPQIVTRNFRCF